MFASLTRRALLRTAVALAIIAPLAGHVTAVAAAPAVGQPAPAFTGLDSDGNSHALADFRGQTVILEWTNHDCPYVQKHYGTGNMQALQKDTTSEGTIWLSVISSAPGEQGHIDGATANALTKQRDAAPTAVLLDPAGEIGRMYDARTTPHMYIIDEQGTLVYRGGIDDRPTANPADVEGATNYVRLALADLAADRPVSEPVTRAYGCSVKYK